MWPMRSRRTLDSITSTPHFSQVISVSSVATTDALVVVDWTKDLATE